MLTPEQYLQVVAERVQRSGGRLHTVRIGPSTAVVGLFAEPILLSTMNYCVVAAPYPEIDALTLHQFTGLAIQHARANVLGTLGWTAASVVIAGLVGRVHPDAAQLAAAKTGNQFGGETRMVAVDPAGRRHAWIGGKLWGAAIHGSVNAKLQFCFPEPMEAYQQWHWQAAQRPGGYPAQPGNPGQSGAPGNPGQSGAPDAYPVQPGVPGNPGQQQIPPGPPGPGGFPGQPIPPGSRPTTGPPPAAGPTGPVPPHYPSPGLPPYGR
ncbi:hypothetical protein [Amycolatopsis sp. PS_44_ISF1]|uniref:hypothetical protein n=1 Tax=Amycolatopsis sp. PS_44_ISF1 TaxID=2974917 RepID=UPI0028DF28D0|nr:hypothetical protein [Amycolatopsis sp. PS_44_ISF1]MDT8910431.1 hypothetical protein [Amycolatopsis sp. PS_44_ISF1]